jgi:2'-5' RNA ligase
MRLFVGINIPKKQRARVHRAVRGLREEELPVRWIDPEHFHVTLKFLGEVRKERIPAIEEALAYVARETSGFTTKFAGFGAFPTVRKPRVIWVGLEATPEFRCMKQDLEWALGQAGFEAETRAFHPHITLGRAEAAEGAGGFRELDRILAGLSFEDDIKVHSVDLMRSHLAREGPHYSVVSSVRLGTA